MTPTPIPEEFTKAMHARAVQYGGGRSGYESFTDGAEWAYRLLSSQGLRWVKASEPPEWYDEEWYGPFIINVLSPAKSPYVTAGYYHLGKWWWAEGKKQISEDFTVTYYAEMPEAPIESPAPIQ